MDKLKLLKNNQNFRKTKKGLLTNLYHKMKSRHAVEFTLSNFHDMFLETKIFDRLFNEWVISNYDKRKKPSIDRINNKYPYLVKNIHMITWGENRFKQTMERRSRKGVVLQYSGEILVATYKSQKEAALKTGYSQSNISMVLNGKRNHCGKFIFKYVSV